MNKLILIPFVLLLILLPSQVFATQFIPYLPNISEPSNPKICVINNNSGDDYFKLTQKAVTGWSDKLNYLTKSHNWNMTVIEVDKMTAITCNIVFSYDLQFQPYTDSNLKTSTGKVIRTATLGQTDCYSGHYTYTHCVIDMYVLNFKNNKSLFLSVQHEFGHALGLNHRVGDTRLDAARAFLSDDLMYPYAKAFSHLTNEDALAVIHMYGVGGFHIVNTPSPFVIDYPTKFPCKYGNATIVSTCSV